MFLAIPPYRVKHSFLFPESRFLTAPDEATRALSVIVFGPIPPD